MRQSPGEEAGGTPSRPPAAGPSNFLHCVARTCIAAFQRAHLVRLVPSSRWTEVVERERGLGNGTERPDLRPTSCTAIGCTPHHRCLPPATRRQGGHQAAPSANSHAPLQNLQRANGMLQAQLLWSITTSSFKSPAWEPSLTSNSKARSPTTSITLSHPVSPSQPGRHQHRPV